MGDNRTTLLIFVAVTTISPIVFAWVNHSSSLSTVIKSFGHIDGRYLGAVFLIFGLNLAFLANDVWGAHDRARAAAATEGDNLRTVARIASGVNAPIGRAVIEALNRYEHYTVEEDWPQLGKPDRVYGEAGGLGAVTVLVSSDTMAAAVSTAVQEQLLVQMSDLRASRNARYDLAEGTINPVKWYFTFFIDLVAFLTVGFGHAHNKRGQYLGLFLFYVVSTPTLSLLVVESNPFSGLNAVKPHALELALDHSTKLLEQMKTHPIARTAAETQPTQNAQTARP
jgi:hypothetical protein